MVYHSSLNFRDVMIASGRVGVEVMSQNRLKQECLIGFEFSGRTLDGRRVAGAVDTGATSSLICCKKYAIWEVPPEYSLEDAATMTIVYLTTIYAFLMVGDIQPGSSVLIHSGTGGIGLAAINVCLYYNCNIFVTVGTSEKREYLKKHYPQIPENHIGNSRDTSFEDMIKIQTQSRGVDFVLNSLSEDKLKASVRCLAPGGCFLEIGKFDLANDTELELMFMEKKASFHGIMLDQILWNPNEMSRDIYNALLTGLKAGYVKPIPRTVFEKEDLISSFRYMTTGKHIGKVLIKLRDEEKKTECLPTTQKFKAVLRYHCNSQCSYVIIGGLGGIGLELADWLILRGARKIILVSRNGLQTGYQTYRIKIWSSYGVHIYLSTKDVTTKLGCVELIKEAQKLGPVDAIFNLAAVLKDALIEDQNEETFAASLAPKAQATIHFDQVTREMCPDLSSFVVFSSVSCGRGNIGQTNYGMANSVMERICEKRKNDGFAALAIQWGAVGEVGLVAKMQKENKDLVIGGTLQQKVSSCFEVLDKFLNQEHPVVSSMVVAEKYNKSKNFASAVEAVAEILGFRDLKTVSQHLTLAELGMDSMMATEIIQILEKDFEIYISPKDMRSLTFAKLTELEAEKKNVATKEKKKALDVVDLLMKTIPEKSTSDLTLISLKENKSGPNIFLFPGIDSVFYHFAEFLKEIEGNINGVQYRYTNPEDTILEMAQNIIPHIEKIASKEGPIFIIGYSYGSIVALEVVKHLECNGYTIAVILIDGSPTYITSSVIDSLPQTEDAEFETAILIHLLRAFLPTELLKNKDKLLKCGSHQERIDLSLSLIPPGVDKSKLGSEGLVTAYKRFKSVKNYTPTFSDTKINSKVHLFKAQFPVIKDEEDYQLTKICKNLALVATIEGDHTTMLNQPELAKSVNEILCCNGK